MISQKINSSYNQRNQSLSKSLLPLRNNSIRGASMNHHSITSQLNVSTQNTSAIQPRVMNKPLTYFIGKGNNEELIRKILSTRSNWIQSDDSTSAFINLKWQQDQKGYKYQRLVDNQQYRAVLNHFQFHQNLSNKEFLFRNLERYCYKNHKDLWKIVPPTFILNSRDQCSMQALKLFIDFYNKNFPRTLKDKRGVTEVQKQIYDERRKLRMYFFNSNLKKILPKNPPLPTEFINKEEGDYLWIVKPTFLNRGRGIFVFSKLVDLTKFVSENVNGYQEKKIGENTNDPGKKKEKTVDYIRRNFQSAKQAAILRDQQKVTYQARQKNQDQQNQQIFDGNHFIRIIPSGPSLIKTDCFLIQKYLQSPMLIFGRKFDIRMWVLVSHSLKAYIFPEGYVRLSSNQYNCKDSKENQFVHLTNNAVQKFSADYGKLVEGNQMSFKDLKSKMEEEGLDFENFVSKAYEYVTISISSCIRKLNYANRRYCFEIFGYDFMIDKAGNPWLIEVNTNPCLEESSPLLKQLLPRMMNDAFKLTIDSLFYGSVSNANFPVQGYNNENMWVNLPVE